ncbi:ABC transporter substrate-binding protein [Fusobacterium sp. MFO224]|uniref:ABC transporter substrate-binding protein n=1 Tax=Fusobacterium sp. MFO224 TaxID=3378070 RepID=UPI003851E7D5
MKKINLFIMSCLVSIFSYSLEIKDNKIYDSRNNGIEVKNYKRIVITDPAIVETFYMLNAEDKIVGIATSQRSKVWPAEKTSKLNSVGNIAKPSFEKIIELQPDLVIINKMSSGISAPLEKMGIPVLLNDVSESIENILKSIKIYGKLLGKEKEASLLYDDSLSKLKTIKKIRGSKIKGVVLYSASPMMAFNGKSLPGQVLELIGVENIAKDLSGSRPIISSEYLLEENPDILMGAMSFKSKKQILTSNPIILKTKSGINGNIFIVDSSKILRGSPRIFDTINYLYKEVEQCQNLK